MIVALVLLTVGALCVCGVTLALRRRQRRAQAVVRAHARRQAEVRFAEARRRAA